MKRAVATITILIVCGLALWKLPEFQVASAKGIEAKDAFKAENDARATLAQIIGGFAVLIGLYFAWERISASAKNFELANQNLEITKETTAKNLEIANRNLEVANQNLELSSKGGQVAERFTKAIEQLGATDDKGKPKLELRLGGIYALERIARDSEKYHWPIMEILTAYLRENAKWKEADSAASQTSPLAMDIQAIITVIRRREWSYEKGEQQRLDLSRVDLHGAYLEDARLTGAELTGAHLDGADLTGAELTRADLDDAHLERASLSRAHLTGAHLKRAYLNNAKLDGASLEYAHLDDAHLFHASLSGAHLREAHLEGADLTGAYLAAADLGGAELSRAELSRADLKHTHLIDAKLHHTRLFGAQGVSQHEIDLADGNPWTRLPPGIDMPKSWNDVPPGLPPR